MAAHAGYSIASVNNRLSAIKVYARLATKAGVVPPTEQALIREAKGYGLTEGKRVDVARPRTRVGYKKEEALVLTAEQARLLKTQHPPPRKVFATGCLSAYCWIWASGPVKWPG